MIDERTARGTQIHAEGFGVAEADLLPAFKNCVGAIFAQEAIR